MKPLRFNSKYHWWPAALFVLAFISLNLLISLPNVQKSFLKHNPKRYFYIGHDWHLKASKALLGFPPHTIIFIGSSMTAFAIAPQQGEKWLRQNTTSTTKWHIENLGLVASSQIELSKFLQLIAQKPKGIEAIFIDINPISVMPDNIKTAQQTWYAKALDFAPIESILPIQSWLTQWLPIIRYQKLLRHTLDYWDDPAPFKIGFEEETNLLHIHEFWGLNNAANRGFVNLSYPHWMKESSKFVAFYRDLCRREDSIDESNRTPSVEGLQKFELTLKTALAITPHVFAWVPPAPREWTKAVPLIYYQELIKLVQQNNIPVLVPTNQKQAEILVHPDYYIDCIHMLASGALINTDYLISAFAQHRQLKPLVNLR